MRNLPFLLGRLFNVPLLVHPARLEAFMLGLPSLLGVDGLEGLPGSLALLRGAESPLRRVLAFDEEDAAAAMNEQSPRYYGIQRGVATIPVHGALVRRAGQMTPDCQPLASYETVSNALGRAMRDPRVRGVLLDIDSPGGEASQLFDLTRQIRAANAIKPVWSIADDDALSAGYALASSAGNVFASETGAMGSIGTVAQHVNQEAYDAKQGLKYTYLFSGAHKVDGNPHHDLTPGAASDMQAEVNRIQSMFVDLVAQNRRMTPDAVRATDARIFYGRDAIHQGLADEIGTPAQAHAALAERINPTPSRRTSAMSEQQPTREPAPAPVPETDPNPAPPNPERQEPEREEPTAQAAVEAMHEMQGEIVSFSSAPITRAEASRIVAACVLADMTDRAPKFLADGSSLAQVRAALADAMAAKTTAAAIVPVTTQTVAGPAAVAPQAKIDAKAAFGRTNA